MVNAAHQLQKRGERVQRNLFPVMPTSAVNDHVSISPKRIRQGIQPSKSKSYRTNDNPTNITCNASPSRGWCGPGWRWNVMIFVASYLQKTLWC